MSSSSAPPTNRGAAQSWRERKLTAGEEVAQEFVADDAVSAVVLAGSLTAGLGTPHSDVDLFVIRADVDDDHSATRQHTSGGDRVDIEIRSQAWLRKLVCACAAPPPSTTDIRLLVSPPRELELAIRILVGQTLKAEGEATPELRRLREHAMQLRQLTIGRRVIIALGKLEDTLGAIEEQDEPSALIVSAELVLHAAEAFLVGAGDLYLGHKWVPAKLTRTGGRAFPLDAALNLIAHPSSDLGGADVALRRIRLAQAMLVAAQLSGWNAPDAAVWTAWGWDKTGVSRTPNWLPLRLSDAIALVRSDVRQLKISERALTVWGACDGRSRDAIIAEVEAAGVEDATSVLEGLVRVGAVLVPER